MEIRNLKKPPVKPVKPPRPKLVRGPDGRLRSADDSTDIGDVWAEQRRIRLAEALEEDKKKAKRQQLRKESGIVGLATAEISAVTTKIRVLLFGQRAVKVNKLPKPTSPPAKPTTQPKPGPHPQPVPQPQAESIKTVEIKLDVPRFLKLSKLKPSQQVATLNRLRRKFSRKGLAITGAIIVIAFVAMFGYRQWSNRQGDVTTGSRSAVDEHHPATLTRGTPDYATILPNGKTIQELGGWARISPPDKNPVYAYADKIDGIDVAVSEQPLPPNFANDTDKQLAQLAQSISASLKLTANDNITVYLGTAPQGPQSVVMAKDNLLVLIKSDSPIPNNQWLGYINSLQ